MNQIHLGGLMTPGETNADGILLKAPSMIPCVII